MCHTRLTKSVTLVAILRGALLVWVALAGVASAARADSIVLTAVDGRVLLMAPGDVATLRLRIQATQAFDATVFAHNAGSSEYTLIGQPAAGCATFAPAGGIQHVLFDPTVASGDLLCEYTIRRSLDSLNDAGIWLWANVNGFPVATVEWVLGTTADVALTTRQESFALLPDGRARGLLRVTTSNPSGFSIDGLSAGSCLDTYFPDFSIDGTIAGGCGPANGYGGACFDYSYGFTLAPVPAQADTSCLVELTSTSPYVHPLYFPIELVLDSMINMQTGGHLLPMRDPPMAALMLAADALFHDGFD